jgi:hypothetical protein
MMSQQQQPAMLKGKAIMANERREGTSQNAQRHQRHLEEEEGRRKKEEEEGGRRSDDASGGKTRRGRRIGEPRGSKLDLVGILPPPPSSLIPSPCAQIPKGLTEQAKGGRRNEKAQGRGMNTRKNVGNGQRGKED